MKPKTTKPCREADQRRVQIANRHWSRPMDPITRSLKFFFSFFLISALSAIRLAYHSFLCVIFSLTARDHLEQPWKSPRPLKSLFSLSCQSYQSFCLVAQLAPIGGSTWGPSFDNPTFLEYLFHIYDNWNYIPAPHAVQPVTLGLLGPLSPLKENKGDTFTSLVQAYLCLEW